LAFARGGRVPVLQHILVRKVDQTETLVATVTVRKLDHGLDDAQVERPAVDPNLADDRVLAAALGA